MLSSLTIAEREDRVASTVQSPLHRGELDIVQFALNAPTLRRPVTKTTVSGITYYVNEDL